MSHSPVEDPLADPAPLDMDTYRDRLRALPPSAKLVAKVLENNGPLTHAELAHESLLPDRTVRYALDRLEDASLIDSRLSLRDARKRTYELRY